MSDNIFNEKKNGPILAAINMQDYLHRQLEKSLLNDKNLEEK
jgi:hypothetical protein